MERRNLDIEVDQWNADLDASLAELRRTQEELLSAEAVGQVENGLITATVHGVGRVSEIKVHPDALTIRDAELLGDLVLEAIQNAYDALYELGESKSAVLNQAITAPAAPW